MLKALASIAIGFICVGIVNLLLTLGKASPWDTVVRVKAHGAESWRNFNGCLADARIEGFEQAVLKDGTVVDVKTGKPIKKIRLPK